MRRYEQLDDEPPKQCTYCGQYDAKWYVDEGIILCKYCEWERRGGPETVPAYMKEMIPLD
jgi:ribosomal protein L37AE/L43A